MSASTSQLPLPVALPPQASPGPSAVPTAQALVCDVVGQTRIWNLVTQLLFDLLRDSENKECIIFARLDDFRSDFERQKTLLEWFPHTPALFWSDTCVEHNGFFGSHTAISYPVASLKSEPASSSTTQTGASTPITSAVGHQDLVSTYFRLIVKILEWPEGQPLPTSAWSSKEYKWHEMEFMSSSSDSRSTVLCFDVPEDVIESIQRTLSASTEQYGGPFGLHVPLLEELVKLYDRSVWSMAKKVRDIEMKRLTESRNRRSSSTSSLKPKDLAHASEDFNSPNWTTENFEYLFEVLRHINHSVESTQMATEVVERMKIACESISLARWGPNSITRAQRLDAVHSLLRGLSARSASNEKRLAGEQGLLSNKISQRDATVSRGIAISTKADSVAMKTIALVTMTFLPATFVTALLGMNLFSIDSTSPGGHLTSSSDLWIYFVIAVPLTAIVLCAWLRWQRKKEREAWRGVWV